MIYATLAYVGEESRNSTIDAVFQVLPVKGDLINFKNSEHHISGRVKEIKHFANNSVEPANIWIGIEPVRD